MPVWILRKVRRRAARSFENDVSRPSLLVSHFLLSQNTPQTCTRCLDGGADICSARVWDPLVGCDSERSILLRQNAVAGQPSCSYFFPTMFFPKLNFVPTTTRTLLRPPFSIFEK